MVAAHFHHSEAAAKVLTRVIDNTFNHSETVQSQHWLEPHRLIISALYTDRWPETNIPFQYVCKSYVLKENGVVTSTHDLKIIARSCFLPLTWEIIYLTTVC